MSFHSSELVAISFVLGLACCYGALPNVQHEFFTIPEGSSGELRFSKGIVPNAANAFACTLSVNNPAQLTLSAPAVVSPLGSEVIVIATAVADGIVEGPHFVEITLACKGAKKVFHQYISDPRPDAIEGDPHFIQSVKDIATGKIHRVCYDVKGVAGDRIEIYKDKKSNSAIEGVLMDDYYMHIIRVSAEGCNVEITPKEVRLNKRIVFDWTSDPKRMSIERNNACMVRKAGNTVEVVGLSKELFGGVNYIVKRSDHEVTGHFLDVNVEGLVNYANSEGLLGVVGNNKFKFYKSVQGDDNISRGTVVVNGYFTTAREIQREGLSCWLMDTENVVYPRPISNFIFSK
ncbi:DgyrCDS4498 [Dimorphilus gyrociliatus]|uniref:DgyrCDS4498 n=1 Tax=Dimorphilus gyrociliatus TaxID=2664684 RepID=A0A7I8VLS9_9ANNE|nr:DgyrCDS4498 [Dimorphilus gyrociliatus]